MGDIVVSIISIVSHRDYHASLPESIWGSCAKHRGFLDKVVFARVRFFVFPAQRGIGNRGGGVSRGADYLATGIRSGQTRRIYELSLFLGGFHFSPLRRYGAVRPAPGFPLFLVSGACRRDTLESRSRTPPCCRCVRGLLRRAASELLGAARGPPKLF